MSTFGELPGRRGGFGCSKKWHRAPVLPPKRGPKRDPTRSRSSHPTTKFASAWIAFPHPTAGSSLLSVCPPEIGPVAHSGGLGGREKSHARSTFVVCPRVWVAFKTRGNPNWSPNGSALQSQKCIHSACTQAQAHPPSSWFSNRFSSSACGATCPAGLF